MSARNNTKKFSNNSVSVVKPFCKVCFDANKPESQYTSHFVRKTKDLNSEILCPIILATECRYCHKLGHTISNCSLRAKNNARNTHAVQAQAQRPVQVQAPAPVRGNNRYAAFDVDEEVEIIEEVKVNETEFPSLGGKSGSVQETTKVSYAKAFASKPSTNCGVVDTKYEEDYNHYCHYEDFSRTQNLMQHQVVVEEEESLTVEEQYGERMYAVLNQYYHSYTGKIVGMLLNCDREELDEFMINARALYERADEAHAILKQAESSVNACATPCRTLAEDNDW